jgi:hypothetical protein
LLVVTQRGYSFFCWCFSRHHRFGWRRVPNRVPALREERAIDANKVENRAQKRFRVHRKVIECR